MLSSPRGRLKERPKGCFQGWGAPWESSGVCWSSNARGGDLFSRQPLAAGHICYGSCKERSDIIKATSKEVSLQQPPPDQARGAI